MTEIFKCQPRYLAFQFPLKLIAIEYPNRLISFENIPHPLCIPHTLWIPGFLYVFYWHFISLIHQHRCVMKCINWINIKVTFLCYVLPDVLLVSHVLNMTDKIIQDKLGNACLCRMHLDVIGLPCHLRTHVDTYTDNCHPRWWEFCS